MPHIAYDFTISMKMDIANSFLVRFNQYIIHIGGMRKLVCFCIFDEHSSGKML